MDNKKMKDAVDQIDIPKEAVMTAIEKGIAQGRQATRKPRNKVFITTIAFASVIGLTLSFGLINPSMNRVLAAAPLIGGIYEEFGDKLGMHLAEQNRVSDLNMAASANGVTVELNNAYFDGDSISVTGDITGDLDKGTNETGELSFDMNFENNNGDSDPWLNGMSTGSKRSESGYKFQWKMAYPYETIQKGFTLPITIHYINGIKGEWTFNIPISQDKIETIAINQSQAYEGLQIDIKEILLANASTTLEFKTISAFERDHIDLYKAVDDLGNELFYYENNTTLSRTAEQDGFHTNLRKNMEKLNGKAQSITFYPSVSISDPPVSKLLNAGSFSLESERSNLGIKVNKIKEEDKTLLVDYEFTGMPENISKNQLDILLNNLSYSLTLIDKKFADKIDPANPVPPASHSISKNKVKLLDKETLRFQSVFDLDGEDHIKNYSLENTLLQIDFSSFIETKKLAPFKVTLPK